MLLPVHFFACFWAFFWEETQTKPISKYDKERRDELLNLAKKMDLYPSAASDRHAEKDSFVRGEEDLLQNMKDAVRKRK